MNEVPHAGVGLYCEPDSPDGRDQWLLRRRNEDRATNFKISGFLAELIERIIGQRWITDELSRQISRKNWRRYYYHI